MIAQAALERFPLGIRSMVISTLRFMPPARRHSELLEILRTVVGPAETQPGCLGCHIYEDDGPEQATILCGHWKTSAALREHIRSDLYLRVLAACELSNQPPEFSFHHVSRTQRMELVHTLRTGTHEKPRGRPAGSTPIAHVAP